MPIFEYLCSDCGKKFEELVTGDQPVTCPSCQSSHVLKQLSVFASSAGSSDSGMPACARPGCGSRFT